MQDVKDFLAEAFCCDRSVRAKTATLIALRELAKTATHTLPTAKGTLNKNKMEDIIIRIVDLERWVQEELERLVALKSDVIVLIERVNSKKQREVLELRYVCCKTWEDIADDMNMTVRNVHYIHGNALTRLKKIF
jgi:DNA-directed RNA polymerase specialized sigma24 family protein